MSVRAVRLATAAIGEVVAARRWYAERSDEAATNFMAELDLAVERVREAPQRWKRIELPGIHRYVFPRYPYSLIYRFDESEVEILAIAHRRQRPGYWKGRT